MPVDVAATTGLALPMVISELNNIASETNAHLEVTESGNIAYSFPGNLQQAYAANASREFFKAVGRVIANVSIIVLRAFCAFMFFLVRISFGIALIAGAVLIVVLIVAVILYGMRLMSGGDGDGGGDSNFDFDFGSIFDFGYHGYGRPFYLYWAFDWLWDWFFYWRYVIPGGYYGAANWSEPGAYVAQTASVEKEKKGGNFLYNVFSYLFGEGNPNEGFDEQKWQAVARIIELNQGVVTAEQLAPYTGQDPTNEDWMIGVLQRFNGSPEVSDSGNIIYIFPAFQSQAGGASIPMGSLEAARQTKPVDDLSSLYHTHVKRQSTSRKSEAQLRFIDKALLEREWTFMNLDGGSITAIVCFGLFVMFGGMGLLYYVHLIPFLVPFSPVLYFLSFYGLLFFMIPGVRYAIYNSINEGITRRNDLKLTYATKVAQPDEALNRKLSEAAQVRISGLPRKPDRTIYSTDRDAAEQETDEDYNRPPS